MKKESLSTYHTNNKNNLLEHHLLAVASEFEDTNKFVAAAHAAAAEIEYDMAKDLPRYFHGNLEEPSHLKTKIAKHGALSGWINIRQDAIFEILYNYKEQAIPLLNKIGFGEYDWTQYKAIAILCRLADEGIDADRIIENIGRELPEFRYEAQFPSLESLASIKNNQKVVEVLKASFDEYTKYDPIDAYYILKMMAKNYPDEARKEVDFLKQIIFDENLNDRSPVLDGAVMSIAADGTQTFSIAGKAVEGNFAEEHRINAAILHNYLSPKDAEINKMLKHWEKNAKNKDFRKSIKEHCK